MNGPHCGHDYPVQQGIPSLNVLGIPIARLTRNAALDEVDRMLTSSGRPSVVVHVNAHALNLANRHPRYRRALRRADLVLNDGPVLALVGRLHGTAFPADLDANGFTPLLLRRAAVRRAPVFLLGGRPGVAEVAARRLTAAIPGLKIAGYHHGDLRPGEDGEIAERIRASGAGLLLAGMSNPQQELWLDQYLPDTGAQLGVAVGSFLDVVAQRGPRAPRWMRSLGLGRVYRQSRRSSGLRPWHVVDNPLLVCRVLRERLLQQVLGT